MYSNVRHPRVFWTKNHNNFLGFGANFGKKSIMVGQGSKKDMGLVWYSKKIARTFLEKRISHA